VSLKAGFKVVNFSCLLLVVIVQLGRYQLCYNFQAAIFIHTLCRTGFFKWSPRPPLGAPEWFTGSTSRGHH